MLISSIRHRTTLGLAGAALMLGACSDATDPTSAIHGASQVSAAILPASGVLTAPGSDFTGFTPDRSGRTTTEFWDNLSADVPLNGDAKCNIGFYATGALDAACINDAPGSDANQPAPGTFTQYLAAADGRSPTPFTFAGNRTYTVTLLGSYAENASDVGWFTKSAGVYTFHAVPNWSNKTVGTQVVVNPQGNEWGFFIRNTSIDPAGSCDPTTTACSDATGGFAGAPYQQFALFASAGQTQLLVGAEDNRISTVTATQDADYNDYIWRVVPGAVRGGEGCSPGYWKNRAFNVGGYTNTTLFSAAFGSNVFGSKTLAQVLATGGGGVNALGRQAVAALLNAASGISYELTTTQVIDRFNAAVAAGGSAIEKQKDEFEALTDVNGRTCPNPVPKR